MLHKTISTVFILLSGAYLHSLPVAHLIKKDWNENRFWVALYSLSFCVMIFNANGRVIDKVALARKAIMVVLRYLCFLDQYCFLSVFEASSSLNGKWGLSGLSVCPCLLRHICNSMPFTGFESLWIPIHYGFTGILGLWYHWGCCKRMGI